MFSFEFGLRFFGAFAGMTTPGSDPINLLSGQWCYAAQDDPQPTAPSVRPRRKIDYIMYKPKDRWKVVEVRVIDEKVASDHCPVFSVLELQPAGMGKNR